MELAKVTSVNSLPLVDDSDWDEADCLCQDKVPSNKAVEYADREFRERDKQWVWKVKLRYHIDCPIHGPYRAPKTGE
jgi:hypothetical protein